MMPSTFSVMNVGICFLPIHLNVRKTGDRIYYLLYLWKQLNFDQERDELHLTGAFYDKEKLMQELRKYIQQVFIMNPASNIDMQALLTCE